ncbi:MAG: hypothetical protein AB1679_07865 [Actinomycetota bacterium]
MTTEIEASAAETPQKKKRGRAAASSGWHWMKDQLADSKLLATIAGVVATGLAMAGLAISEADLRQRIGVLEAPARLQPVVDRLDDVEGAVSALRAKDPVALISPRVEEIAAELGGLQALFDKTAAASRSITAPAAAAPAPVAGAPAYDPAPLLARLDTADKKLAALADSIAAEQARAASLSAGLEAAKAEVAAARSAIDTLRSDLTALLDALKADLEATKKKLTAGTQLPTNHAGQVTWCFGAGRFTQKPYLSAVAFKPASFGGTEAYLVSTVVANQGCATFQVWSVSPTAVAKAGANVFVNLMAVQP